MPIEVWKQLVVAVPAATAVIVTVYIFVKFLTALNISMEARLQEISTQCHAVQKDGHQIQAAGQEVMRQTNLVMAEMTLSMRELRSACETMSHTIHKERKPGEG